MKIIKKSIIVSFIVILTIVASKTTFASNKTHSIDLLSKSNRTLSYAGNNAVSTFQKNLIFKKAGKHDITFRAIFQVENPENFVSLSLEKSPQIKNLTLNGKSIPKPFEGTTYKIIPGSPVSLLKKGENEFQATWTQKVKVQKNKKDSKTSFVPNQINSVDLDIRLFGMTSSALAFQTGPILGYASENMFTVSCRVNMPAEVVLEVNGREYVSKKALLHSFKVKGLTAHTQYQYSLKARVSPKDDFQASIGPFSMRTLNGGDKFSFAVLGDSRSLPDDWAKVATAVVAKKPEFAIFVGDMVTWGRNDYEWDEQFFCPAKNFFSSIPFYAVIGNHEGNCPLFTQIFPTPGGKNWSQKIGTILIIGIDGTMDWESNGVQTKWLENILANSKAKFIFLNSHYPAWTSGCHGGLKNGRPQEKPIKLAQDVLMPLLKKYNATAMFAGHDHFYERSEPDDGVSMIISGGAGAPLRNKVENSEKQNPHSKVFASKLHYCFLTVDKDVCTIKVITPDNVVIDTRIWKARKEATINFWNKLLTLLKI